MLSACGKTDCRLNTEESDSKLAEESDMWYEKDMPYLLDEEVVDSEQKQYFTDWAIEQLTLTDWDLLDEQWSPDLYAYDRNYELRYILGKSNYSFSYVFYPDKKEDVMDEVNYVNITCSVNSEGKKFETKR